MHNKCRSYLFFLKKKRKGLTWCNRDSSFIQPRASIHVMPKEKEIYWSKGGVTIGSWVALREIRRVKIFVERKLSCIKMNFDSLVYSALVYPWDKTIVSSYLSLRCRQREIACIIWIVEGFQMKSHQLSLRILCPSAVARSWKARSEHIVLQKAFREDDPMRLRQPWVQKKKKKRHHTLASFFAVCVSLPITKLYHINPFCCWKFASAPHKKS